MMKNKKGVAVHWLMMVATVLFVLIPFLISINFLVTKLITVYVDTYGLENYILINRIYYSKDSFWCSNDVTGRVNPGIVDLNKFNDGVLSRLFDGESQKTTALRLTLKSDEESKEIYYNKEIFDIGFPVAEIEGSRYGVAEQKRFVLVNKEGKLHKAKLLIQLIYAND